MEMSDKRDSLKVLIEAIQNVVAGSNTAEIQNQPDENQKAFNPSLGWLESHAYRLSRNRSTKPELDVMIDTIQDEFSRSPQNVLISTVGTVQHVGNGVAHITGLPDAGMDELVIFENGVKGLTLNLGSDAIDVILLGPDEDIHGGDLVISQNKRLTIPVSKEAIGRVIDPLGNPLDEKKPYEPEDLLPIEKKAPGIVERDQIDTPLYTGTKKIDALIPIGRGQRELIAGDRQTGKSTLAIDTILNQKDEDVLCIYVAIGQKKSSLLSTIRLLEREGAMAYTTVIIASPDDPPALRYIAPFAGCTLAEYFADQGKDVLIIYDDLSKHADAYREISLLLKRPPGREAYPGDIFYLHSRLLERAGKWSAEKGGGSITAMPIVTLQQGNVASYIPTNLISISDGQIILDTGLFNRGVFPAINIDLSVSRVGGSAQIPAMRKIASKLKLEFAQFGEIEKFAQFGSEIDEETLRKIHEGRIMQQALAQPAHRPYSSAEQFAVLYALVSGSLFDLSLDKIETFEKIYLHRITASTPEFLLNLSKDSIFSEDIGIELNGFIDSIIKKDKI